MASSTTTASVPSGTLNIAEVMKSIDMTRRDTLTGAIFKVNIVFICLITTAVSLRLYSRFRILRQWGADDGEIPRVNHCVSRLTVTSSSHRDSFSLYDRHVRHSNE